MSVLQVSQDIGGHPTQILVQTFADRFFVLVTQLGKVGSLIQASIPESVPLSAPVPNPDLPNQHPLPSPSPAIQLTPLFGSASTEHMHVLYSLYASQIATLIWTQNISMISDSPRRSVVIGLGLRNLYGVDEATEQERITFQGVMSILQDLISHS